jgi:hypothetical protein
LRKFSDKDQVVFYMYSGHGNRDKSVRTRYLKHSSRFSLLMIFADTITFYNMRPGIFTIIVVLLFLCFCKRDDKAILEESGTARHSLADELRVFYDLSTLPLYADSTICAQTSTFDTTWGNDDGFSGRYSFLRRNDNGSLIIFDVRGGGVINRIWTPTPSADTLDFFINDTLKPAFSICYLDLFSGKQYPFVAPLCGNQLGGFYCYMPIPFEKCCRIVTRGKKEQFHQIQYRLYENGSGIRSFTTELNQEEKEALKKINQLWNKEETSPTDFCPDKLTASSKQITLSKGKASTIFDYKNGGRIMGIELSPASAFEGLNKNTDIKITWDGENNPAVFCPVADFFGYAFGAESMKSLLLGSRNNKAYCYFPMPFDKSAKIELVERKGSPAAPVEVKATIWYSTEKRHTGREGKFYAAWKKITKEQAGKPHIFADITGKGHYVGTLLQAQGLKAGMTIFFEGDDSTSIDGSFRLHGTGSEDYFNGGWYAMMDRWDDKMSLPLHGSLGYSLPLCRTGGYRFYLSDKLSFEKSFFHSIEHGPEKNNFPSDYTSLGLYYCDSPSEDITVPSDKLTTVFIPDTLFIYPQLMDFTLFGKMNVETTWKYGTGGESYYFTPGEDSWLRFSMKEIPEGKYSLCFDLIKDQSGCEFSLWQRQKQLSHWISSYSVKEERANDLYVCDIAIPETYTTLTLRFRTDGQKKRLLLNRIRLIRK